MRVLVVDSASIGSRAFYTKGIAFFNMVETVAGEVEATHVIFCFDSTEASFRKRLYPDYKGHRPEDRHREQYITSVAVALEKSGYMTLWGPEADDVIGSVVKSLPDHADAFIFSSDSDLFQLVGANVKAVWCGRHFKDRQVLDAAGVFAMYGVNPHLITDYLGLAGDASDNIPGVTGIGEKGAKAILETYGNAEQAFEYADQMTGRYAKKLQAATAREEFELSKTLATIQQQELKLDWKQAEYKNLAAAVRTWINEN